MSDRIIPELNDPEFLPGDMEPRMKTMMSEWIDGLTKDPEGMRNFQQERAVVDASCVLWDVMAEQGCSAEELAKRLGRPKRYVDRLLNGKSSMSIRKLSDVMTALGKELRITAVDWSL